MNTLTAPINAKATTAASWLNKVPEVTLSFWIIKIMCTTVGETGADYLAVNAGLGQNLTRVGMTALLVATGYMVINTVMGSVIEPRWMGRNLGLSTLVVFLSLIFWGWLLGTVGMLLSVPLTMIVKIALEATDEGRWLAVLLGPAQQLERELENPRLAGTDSNAD